MEKNQNPPAELESFKLQQKRFPKTGRIKVFFRWFFILFFVLLLVAGIYFRAPWKVLGLFLIVFIVPCLIPKRYDKGVLYFLFGAGLLLLAWCLWPTKPDPQWKPYAFENEIRAWQRKYEIPDVNNSAVVYRELLASKDWENQRNKLTEWDPNSITLQRSWRREEFPEIAEYLKEHKSTIEMLEAAAEYEKCWFGFEPNIAEMDSLEVTKNLKTAFEILIRSCNVDIAQGDLDPATEKLHAAVILSSHLKQQRMLVPFLTGIGIDGKVCAVLKRWILEGSMSREQTIQIQGMLEKMDVSWDTQWPAMMEFEKLTMKKHWAFLYEVNEQGRTRIIRSRQSNRFRQNEACESSYKERVLDQWLFLLRWLVLPDSANEISREIDTLYDLWIEKGKGNDFRMQKSEEPEMPGFEMNFRYVLRLIHSLGMPAYSNMYNLYLRQQSRIQGTRLCMAIWQYKDQYQVWPADLEACRAFVFSDDIFIDPLNDGTYVFQNERSGFRLYSKGLNGVDDGGEYEHELDRKTARYTVLKDDILIWPPEERCR